MIVQRHQVEAILVRAAGGDAKLSDDARLIEDLGLDSLDAVEIVSAIEELAAKSISDSALEQMRTVGDVMRLAGVSP